MSPDQGTLLTRRIPTLDAHSEALAVQDDAHVAEILEDESLPAVLHDEPRTLAQADPYYGAADLDITDAQRAILSRPFPPDALEILPTGEVYLPQVDYRKRLNEALGIGRWALRPLDAPKVIGKTVTRWYALYVNGKYASDTFGESDYHENNARSSWATALESAKSNALMRCCKDIGINLECWDRDVTDTWKAKYATKTSDGWKKRSTPATQNTTTVAGPTAEAKESKRAEAPSQTSDPGSGNSDDTKYVKGKTAELMSEINGHATTATIAPRGFGKIWDRGGYVVDDNNDKWSFAKELLSVAEVAILEGKRVKVTYKVSGKFRNVSKAEVIA